MYMENGVTLKGRLKHLRGVLGIKEEEISWRSARLTAHPHSRFALLRLQHAAPPTMTPTTHHTFSERGGPSRDSLIRLTPTDRIQRIWVMRFSSHIVVRIEKDHVALANHYMTDSTVELSRFGRKWTV